MAGDGKPPIVGGGVPRQSGRLDSGNSAEISGGTWKGERCKVCNKGQFFDAPVGGVRAGGGAQGEVAVGLRGGKGEGVGAGG